MLWTGYRRVKRQHYSLPPLSFLAMALFGGVGAAGVQLPPNTGMSLVADVTGTTIANDAFWKEKCKVIPEKALFIVVIMGKVFDFFKPVEGANFCMMLHSHDKHQWSRDGLTWIIPTYNKWDGDHGSSADYWPRDNVAGDVRFRLSSWGHGSGLTGGCCSTSTAVESTCPPHPKNCPGGGNRLWGQTFSVSYATIQLQPLPRNTGMSLVADVAGTTRADDAFWAEQCQIIPLNALFIVVDMGAVRDFFRPAKDVSFCEMMQTHSKHQWSYNGVDWVTPTFHAHSNNGGSAGNWPLNKGRAEDKRKYLSFWGTNHDSPSLTGGCCSTSTAVDATRPSLNGNNDNHPSWGQSCT